MAPGNRPAVPGWLGDLRTLPSDAVSAWHREGGAGTWAEIAHRTIDRLARWSRSLVIEQPLATYREVPVPSGVEIRPFIDRDWNQLAPIATRRERAFFAVAGARGRTCLVAWRRDRPVGYTWCSHRIEPDIELYPLPLPADGCYLWRLYVCPAERGSGIGSALVSARLRWGAARNYRVGWRTIAPTNTASLRTAVKTAGAGARIVGELRYVKLFGWPYARYATALHLEDDVAALQRGEYRVP